MRKFRTEPAKFVNLTLVSYRGSPTEAIRAEIDALCTGDRDLVEILEDVARLGPA